MSRIITSIVSVLVGTLLVPAAMHTTPAHAAPAEPKPGDRITIALTSDRQYNSAATWFDAHNRMQTQTDLPLPRQDQKSRLWTGTMVYTNAIRDPHLDVMFQSTGNYALRDLGERAPDRGEDNPREVRDRVLRRLHRATHTHCADAPPPLTSCCARCLLRLLDGPPACARAAPCRNRAARRIFGRSR